MPSDPTVLAFDTSAAHCAAALLSGGRIITGRHEEMGRGQAERLMPFLEEMLSEVGLNWRDLDAIGVGVGPGNFTGIRISVSAARGLALGLGIPAIGVSLLDALALDGPRPLLACLPAPRGQAYVQLFAESAPSGPELVLPEDAERFRVTGIAVTGPAADLLAPALGARVLDPVHAVAPAIAHLAARRLGAPQPRPTPLYIRPADAAPPRDPAPVILP